MNPNYCLWAGLAFLATACSVSRDATGASDPAETASESGSHVAGAAGAGGSHELEGEGPAAAGTAGEGRGGAGTAAAPASPAGSAANGEAAGSYGSDASNGGGDGSAMPSTPEGSGEIDPDDSLSPPSAPLDERALHTPSPTLRRLTRTQMELSLEELLGETVDELPLSEIAPVSGLRALGASSAPLSDVDMERWESTAHGLAERFVAQTERITATLGCDPSESACAKVFVLHYGRRLFRRSLTEVEATDYERLRSDAQARSGSTLHSLQVSLAALLQSPYFLYRVELGEPDGLTSDGLPTARLSDVELASRLAFFLWNRHPDDALLTAAEQGELSTESGLAAQIDRMLADPAAVAGFEAFIGDLLAIYLLDDLAKIPEVYPQTTPTLAAAMKTETQRFMRELLWTQEVDYRAVFSATETFVDSELAALYGIPEPGTPFASVGLPADGPRAGLLTQGGILALTAHPSRSSPTLRGKYVRERLLCQSVPPPPPTVNTTLPEASTAPTARDRLEVHRTDPACAGCHTLTDPVGLGLENFDGIGAYRIQENGATIDPSGELDGTPFSSARELGVAIGNHPSLPGCLVTAMLRYARGTVEDRTESAWLRLLREDFSTGDYRVRPLMRAMVLSVAFRKVGAL